MKKVLVVDDVEKWRKFNSGAVRAVLGDDTSITTANSAAEGYNLILQNITMPFNVIENNADEVKDDTYTWVLNENQSNGLYSHKSCGWGYMVNDYFPKGAWLLIRVSGGGLPETGVYED